MNLNIQNPQDVNYLRQLLASGQISQQDLQNLAVQNNPQPNALAQMVQPPQAPPTPQPQQQAPQMPPPPDLTAPTQDLRAQGQQFVRNEDTGQTIGFGPQGMQGMQQPQGQPQGQPQQPQQPQVKVLGLDYRTGQVNQLPPEAAGPPSPLDLARGKVEIAGVGTGFYTKDGKSAIIDNGDGSKTKVILGYDARASNALNMQALQQQKMQADIAHTQEATRASQVNTPDFGSQGVGGTPGQGITGDQFLKTLDPQMAAQVKAYADGRMAFPAGFALKSPYFQNMMRLVGQYDPTFDAVNYAARAKTRTDFTSGTSANNITALNTAVQHLGKLSDAFTALDNGDYPTWNKIINTVGTEIGSKKIQGGVADVKAASSAVAGELAKVFRSSGMSQSEIQDWQSQIDPNAAPSSWQHTINSALNLMQGRLEALGSRYNQGMGQTVDPLQLLNPQARDTILKLQGTPSEAVPVPAPGIQPRNGSGTLGQPAQAQIPPQAISYLRQNPGMRVAFDMKYGQGASAQVLGQ